MNQSEILSRAGKMGQGPLCRRLILEGRSNDYILDELFKAIGKGLSRPKRSIDEITDEELVRALSEPATMNLD